MQNDPPVQLQNFPFDLNRKHKDSDVPGYFSHGALDSIQPGNVVTHPAKNVLQSESLENIVLSEHFLSEHTPEPMQV